ncbi:pimeloyl-ACP methyl ester carboxylesterase [Jatrophihabitans sp. GAS493]|uniref:alpha/beta fold hydrolase n=1 Tax=Jatrophihabitans sp. GAS493 TaxID=1907575 RepID=UPI000BB81077|nr:alpha/beta fold hydrolase [Jatrophihabitans sp. GAS493]SOD70477.1 pimeloyl-ACP methyl ester carboxylesterase [Jatrophihabitans sp. GAS493]
MELPVAGPSSVSLHGHDLAYLDSGTGPNLLLVHGLLSSNRTWAGVIDDLDDEYRLIAPDLFGHGTSAKPRGDYSLGAHAATLRDLIDRLDIDRVTLVGHSLGGGIAMQFCYLFPERVERLVLVSSGGLGRAVSPLLRSATLPGAEWVLPLIAAGWIRGTTEAVGRTLAKVGLRASSDMAEAWYGFTQLGDAESRRAFLATTRAVIDPGGQTISAHEHLPLALDIRCLIAWGARDPIIPVEHAVAAHEAIEGSRLEIFERAGHFPHLDEPRRFARLLSDFVAE